MSRELELRARLLRTSAASATIRSTLLFLILVSIVPSIVMSEDTYHYKIIPTESANSYRQFIPATFLMEVPYQLKASETGDIFNAIQTYLDKKESIFAPEVGALYPEKYSFQLLGFISRGKKVVLVNAYLKDGKDQILNRAFRARDGGCGYVRMYFEVGSNVIVDLECNGEA